MSTILKIAHRGAKGYAPENTLAAFQKAIDMQADGIELDVHLSLDGQLVVIHDDTLERTTNGKGFVKDYTLEQLKAFRIEGKEEIPTLAEVFDLVNRKCFINVELIGEGTAEPAQALIEKYIAQKKWSYDDFIVSSFNWNYLQQLRLANPEIRIGILAQTDIELAFSFAKFMEAEAIHPYFHLLTEENTKKLQLRKLKVYPWTVNEPEDIEKMKLFKVDGIITDFTDRI
jgi:glycerophosphoryl diester phosphodiesterase